MQISYVNNYKLYLFVSLLFFTFYTAPIFSYSPVRFGDIGCLIIIYKAFAFSRKISINTLSISYILLLFWCLFEYFILSITLDSFLILNHSTQLFRLSFSILMAIVLDKYLSTIEYDKIILILYKVLKVHIYICIAYFILYFLGFDFIFNKIDSFDKRLSLIDNNYLFFNHFILVHTFSGFPRFCGLFEEPAWMGWTLNLLISFIFQYEINCMKSIISKYDYWLIFIAMIVSQSVSSLFVFVFILILKTFFKHGFFSKYLLFVLLTLVFVFSVFYLFNSDILIRVNNIVSGSDGSSSSRLIGSFNALITVLHNNPICGVGLGDDNSSNYFRFIIESRNNKGISLGSVYLIEVHNLLVQLVVSIGVIGFAFFITPLLLLLKHAKLVFVTFILVFFSVNVFNTYYMFFMCALSYYLFVSNYSCYEGDI